MNMMSQNLVGAFVRHKVASTMLMLMLILGGIWGIRQINIQLNPSQTYNLIEVDIQWHGASAEDVERMITQPIENHLRSVDRLQNLTSTTRNGSVAIQLEFKSGSDNARALDEVKQRIDRVRGLPEGMEKPIVREYVHYELIAAAMIYGDNSLDELISLSKTLEQQLLDAGIDKVEFRALPEQEIAIQIESMTLLELGMSLDQIAQHINDSSSDVPSGMAGKGAAARILRGLDQQRDVEGFNQLPILGNAEGHLITLGDIAVVEQRYRDHSVTATHNNRPAIMLRILREPGTDTLEEAQLVRRWHQQVTESLGPGIDVKLFLQAWMLTQEQIELVIDNGLSGLLLVVSTLFLFLNVRLAGWVSLGIVVSFMAAILLFQHFGGTINALSLVGLVMALGIVVDDAIVVSEHAQYHFERGADVAQAATLAATNMVSPIMASSLTTLAAFIPIMLVDGGALREIPLLMMCIIVVSVVECFLVLPGHLHHSFKAKKITPSEFRRRFDHWFNRMRDHYFMLLLSQALSNRRTTLSVAVVALMLAFTLLLSGRIKPELSVQLEFEYIEASVKFSEQATQADKSRIMQQIELSLRTAEQYFDQTVVENHVNFSGMAFFDHDTKMGEEYAHLLVELVAPNKREVTIEEFARQWRSVIQSSHLVEAVQFKFGDSLSTDLSLYFQGSDTQSLKQAAQALKARLRDIPGVSEVYDDLPYGKEQWVFRLNTRGRELGLTAESLGRQVQAAYEGVRIQVFDRQSSEIEVRVKLPDHERFELARVKQFPVRTPEGVMLPLQSVADIDSRNGIEVIQHYNARQAVNIYASVDNKITTPMEVIAQLERKTIPDLVATYQLQYGLSAKSAEQRRIAQDLLLGAVIGLSLMYIILCWIFSSYSWPLVVMSAIPLALTGALGGLYLLNMNLGVMSILGLFTLAGVIVNDSIILLTTYNTLRCNGVASCDAIKTAVSMRFRPVILTSLTTSVGLVPMLFENSLMGQVMQPLATVICFGMLYGTLLILLIIPVLLSLLESLVSQRRSETVSLQGV